MSHLVEFINLPIAALIVVALGIAVTAVVIVVVLVTRAKYGMRFHWKGGGIELKPSAVQEPELHDPPATAIVKRK